MSMQKGLCRSCDSVFTFNTEHPNAKCICGYTNTKGLAMVRYRDHCAQSSAVADVVAFNPSEGTRKDGKIRMDLVMKDMPRAIEALARVMTWALAEKGYKESDWLNVPDGIREYHGGMHRHDNKEMRGQEFDDESNLEHAIHTAWNAMARVELILRKKEQQS